MFENTVELTVYGSVIAILLVIIVLMYISLSKKTKQIKTLGMMLENTKTLSFEEALHILEVHITSALIELRLTYIGDKVAELSMEMDEVIKERSADVLSNLSAFHIQSLERYMTKRFLILFISRNIREQVLEIVGQK